MPQPIASPRQTQKSSLIRLTNETVIPKVPDIPKAVNIKSNPPSCAPMLRGIKKLALRIN